jgi:hypothetical protein
MLPSSSVLNRCKLCTSSAYSLSHGQLLSSDHERYSRNVRWMYDTTAPPRLAARGNPVKSATVEMAESTIRNIIASRKTPRRHAKAISIQDMNATYQWSLTQCPADFKMLIHNNKLTADDIKRITLHLFWRAFSSTAFKLWTRCIFPHPFSVYQGFCLLVACNQATLKFLDSRSGILIGHVNFLTESNMFELTCCIERDGSVMHHQMTTAANISVVRTNGVRNSSCIVSNQHVLSLGHL